jgi:hypothetical protein
MPYGTHPHQQPVGFHFLARTGRERMFQELVRIYGTDDSALLPAKRDRAQGQGDWCPKETVLPLQTHLVSHPSLLNFVRFFQCVFNDFVIFWINLGD